jgi:NADPH2:quinone reductase
MIPAEFSSKNLLKERKMVAAVRVHKVGGPEVLTYEQVEVPAPGQGQIRVKQHACGVNFIDTYFRMGMYPSPVGLPFVAGNEGAGEVVAVGSGVTDFKVGDRVGYVTRSAATPKNA